MSKNELELHWTYDIDLLQLDTFGILGKEKDPSFTTIYIHIDIDTNSS